MGRVKRNIVNEESDKASNGSLGLNKNTEVKSYHIYCYVYAFVNEVERKIITVI